MKRFSVVFAIALASIVSVIASCTKQQEKDEDVYYVQYEASCEFDEEHKAEYADDWKMGIYYTSPIDGEQYVKHYEYDFSEVMGPFKTGSTVKVHAYGHVAGTMKWVKTSISVSKNGMPYVLLKKDGTDGDQESICEITLDL